jgi:GT2 family glycosyltransferase
MDVTASIVTYQTDENEISSLLNCLSDTNLGIRMILVDNSPNKDLGSVVKQKYTSVEYVHNEKNVGYGAAHNMALRESIRSSKYNLVVNPDISFNEGTLEKIYSYMENHLEVGLLMPKILYPDGSVQYLCKLLPTPFDLLIRRFSPVKSLFKKKNERYELRFTGYDSIMEVPYLSGCFMFMRSAALLDMGIFDERFFMYLEDTDLSRRIYTKYKTLYYPAVQVYHQFKKSSYKKLRPFFYHTISAIKYFNKWGWIFDTERREINSRTLESLLPTQEKL